MTSISWKDGPDPPNDLGRGHASPGSVLGQSESGSGIAIASALSVGVGLRRAEISESRSPLSGDLSGLLSGPRPIEIRELIKIGPCVGHSYVRTSL